MVRTPTLRWVLVSSMLLAGCMSPAYRVPVTEVQRLAELPPWQRGDRVRVAQLTGWERVPEASDAGPLVPGARFHSLPRATASSSYALRTGGATSPRGTSGRAALGAGIATIAIGTAAFAVLAATEGSRHDGWARLSPGAMILLEEGGVWTRMPLAEMTRGDASLAQDALVLREPGFTELERAPLDRTGVAYGIDLGAGTVIGMRDGSLPWWPSAQLRLGGFLLPWLGLYGTAGFVFAGDMGALVDVRLGGEIQAIPVQIGIANLGVYARGGDQYVARDDDGGRNGAYAGGGLVVELEVSTHLGVSLRGGVDAVLDRGGWLPAGTAMIGATVY